MGLGAPVDDRSEPMIYAAKDVAPGASLKVDLCVVGSGPGGATAAMVAAASGQDVLILEAGELVTPARSTQREEEMYPRLFWGSGGQSTADRQTRVLQGHGLGGSSLHNLNLCKRIDERLLSRWHTDRKLDALSPSTWRSLYAEVEALLSVKDVPVSARNRHNELLAAGCATLGWRGGPLRHNRTGCVGSGFCELGCAFDAKNNALKVCLSRFLRDGGRALTGAQALRLHVGGGRVRGVQVAAVDRPGGTVLHTFEVAADRVCLAGSATGTPALLLRSEVPDASGSTGRTLRLHPAVVAAGEFDEPVSAFEGIPQSYECTELIERRLWIVPTFGHPMGVATLLPGLGSRHAELMRRLPHFAAFGAMLHDRTAGTVSSDGELGWKVDYDLETEDREDLSRGLIALTRLLFAAGARRVILPFHEPLTLERGAPLPDPATLDLRPGRITLGAVHPMGSVAASDDPNLGAVDSRGRHHAVRGLYVADGSLFPTSTGGPPQLSIYALGLHVGRVIIDDL